MIVTSLDKVPREARYRVYLDGQYAVTLSGDSLSVLRIREGKQYTPAQWAELVDEAQKEDAYNALLNALGTKPYTQRMAWDKLRQKEHPDHAIRYAIDRMMAMGYIDDLDYAMAYVQETGDSRSKMRIRHDLMQKGIASQYIDQALLDVDESSACFKSLSRKLRNRPLASIDKDKLVRYLAGQGFQFDTIREAMALYDQGFQD